LRFHAAQFACLDFEATRQLGAWLGERDFVAHLVVFRPANDLPDLPAAIVDLTNAEPISIRVRR
jgi:hypothetical protein